MKRTITLSELKKAVDAAYEQFKDLDEGTVDARLSTADTKKFGIAVVLADGTVIEKGDTDTVSPVGAIAKLPVASILLTQNSPGQLMKKAGLCCCGDNCKTEKPHAGVSAHGVRAVSAIEPVGDSDSKWDFIVNQMIGMMGSAPVLDDSLYEKMSAENLASDAVNKFAAADYYLYDDTAMSIDLYTRAQSMCASAKQLAVMGATIVADGVNPVTSQVVFDGSISPRLSAMMAVKGPHKMAKPWLISTGLPAASSFGGAIMGVLPGVLAIAAYAPAVNEKGVSVKGAKAIVEITNSLKLNAFSNSCIEIVTTK